jgi:hypothetical protein
MRPLRLLGMTPLLVGACSAPEPARLQFDNAVSDFRIIEVDVPSSSSYIVLRNVGGEVANVVLHTDAPEDATIESDTCGWLEPDESCGAIVSLTANSLGLVEHELRAEAIGLETAVMPLVAHGGYRVTVIPAGGPSGRITAVPDRLSCGGGCTGLFPDPDVTIQAHSYATSRFVAWDGAPGCSTSETCTLTLTSSLTMTATFEAVSGP